MQTSIQGVLIIGLAWGSIAGCGSDDTSSSTAAASSGGNGPSIEVQSYLSDPGFAVNSHLLIGSKSVILVDGQFLNSDAEKVAAMVKATGKTLTTVFLTHAHPDHYLGFEILQKAFPGARFVATANVLGDFAMRAAPTLAGLRAIPELKPLIATSLVTPEALKGTTLDLDGTNVDVYELPQPGEIAHDAGLSFEVHGAKVFVSGDLLYNKAYLWLAECQEAGWKTDLDTVEKLGYQTYYPGHGPKGGDELFAMDRTFMDDVIPILTAAATPDAAKMQIYAKYPNDTWAGAGYMDFNVGQYFQNCKKSP